MAPPSDRALAAPPEVAPDAGRRLVVWRTWRLRPEGRDGPPLLTGWMGFPWRQAVLDAKCLHRDPDRERSVFVATRSDRHHPVIPDPSCSCGIYADADSLARPRRLPGRRASVSGFVALSGRVLATSTGYRAQRAEIVGPLLLHVPGPARVRAVLAEEDRYRPTRFRLPAAVPLDEWLEATRHGIAVRYGVRLVTPAL